jgi:hypothetical protein
MKGVFHTLRCRGSVRRTVFCMFFPRYAYSNRLRFPLTTLTGALSEHNLVIYFTKGEGSFYSIPPYKRSPYEGRILLIDVLGRRRPVGSCKRILSHRCGTL